MYRRREARVTSRMSWPSTEDAALVHVHEAQEQLGERRLARARRAHQGHVLTGPDGQGEVVEEGRAGPVAEPDVVEVDPAPGHLQASGTGPVGHLDGLPGDGGELGGAAQRPGQGPEVLEGLLQAEGHLGRVVEDQVERGGRGPVVHGHGGPGHQGQQGADHDGRLQLQLGAHEDGAGPEVGGDRLVA